MSADPLVQAPFFSQSYNRYTYTFNNPLSFNDPSGYGSVAIRGATVSGSGKVSACSCTSYTSLSSGAISAFGGFGTGGGSDALTGATGEFSGSSTVEADGFTSTWYQGINDIAESGGKYGSMEVPEIGGGFSGNSLGGLSGLGSGKNLFGAAAQQGTWEQMSAEFQSSLKEAYELGQALDTDGYINKVATDGDWDFKNRAEYKHLPGVEEFGNFAFGATAQAWADGASRGLSSLLPDISINMAMRGAGFYQQFYQARQYRASDGTYSDLSSHPGSTNFGDNWRDGAHIWMGGQYYYRNRDSIIR